MFSTILFLLIASTVSLIGFYVLTVVVEHVNNIRADRSYRRTAAHFNARVLYSAVR